MFRIGLVQMRVAAADKAANLSHARQMIGRAAAGGAQVVVLPEVMDCGWMAPPEQASAIPGGDTCAALADAARLHNVYVCSGVTERAPDGRVYNAAVLLDPSGKL